MPSRVRKGVRIGLFPPTRPKDREKNTSLLFLKQKQERGGGKSVLDKQNTELHVNLCFLIHGYFVFHHVKDIEL